MTRTILLATTALVLTAGPAFAANAAQTAETPAPASAVADDASRSGVLVFKPDFFAAQRPNTALDMVNRVPGFAVNDGSGARGFEGAVGNILINNNRPASKNDTGSNVLSRTPASQVERIELIRGGASGIDMQGYSVIVNVILKTTASRQSILTWNAAIFDGGQDLYGGSYQFTAGEGARSWGVTLSDGIGNNDSNGPGRTIRRDGAGNIIRDESYENDGYGGGRGIRGNYTGPVAGGKLDATARYGVNDWQSWSLQRSAVALRESDYAEESKSGELGLTFTRPIMPRWALETRAIHEFETFEDVSTGNETLGGAARPEQRFSAEGESSESIARALVRHERSAALTFEAGGEVAYNMLEIRQAFTQGGVAVPLPSASVKVEETRGEAFSKATWRVNPKLTLEGGLRLETSTIKQSGDADQEKSFFYAKPRFLATWTPVANNQLRVRFERELGQLDFGDFAASAELEDDTVYGGNVDLEPEQRWISEVTYERRFLGEGIVSIGYRHDEIIGVIDRLPLPGGLSATGNIGNGTLDKLSVNIVVPLDRFGIKGGRFTAKNDWNETHVTDPTTGKDRPISRIRPTQANIGFQQDLVKYKIQWGINWLPLLGQGTYDVDQTSVWRGANYYESFVEYKPTPTLALRAQLNLWDDYTNRRTVFSNRTTRTVAFVEDRAVDPRTFMNLRLRKTF
ncbi:TonB-dependent receptor plug domain-containing protein [Caulobacter sp. DWR1-3-2b1]|uniref:TonB-dependent receptor plug domain-containing protein n=1 Tax=Caulobacter sp. DWR1-3-2b1 TaxID=2804670 RepID=UPI003CF52DDB